MPEAAPEGISKPRFIESMDGSSPADNKIEDKYNLEKEIDREALAKDFGNDEEEEGGKKRDAATVKREEFLNIYKEDKDASGQGEDDTPDLSSGIRFKADEPIGDDSGFELKTSKDAGSGKPLIQEIGTQPALP